MNLKLKMSGRGCFVGGVLLAASALGFAEAAVGAGSTSEAADTAPADTGGLTEIVVTARKRSENLLQTPVAVQVLSGDALNSSQTNDLVGLSSQVPQVLITKFPSGAGAVIAIRGIGSPSTDPGIESTVSTVFDGVQLSRGLITSLGFFDVQSVQVLKGPQALFFGKNSPAGVVAVTSVAPSDHWEGYADEAFEFKANETVLDGAIGGPVAEGLKIRFAMKYDKSNGYLTNAAGPQTVPNPLAGVAPGLFPDTYSVRGAPAGHWPGDLTLLGRFTVAWDPADNFSAALHLLGGHLHNQSDGPGVQNKCGAGGTIPYELGVPVPGGSCSLSDTVVSYYNPLMFARRLPFSSATGPFSDFVGTLDSMELNYTAGPISVTSVTGFANYTQLFAESLDAELGLFSSAGYQTYGQGSEEIRISSHFAEPVNFVAGAIYEKQRFTNELDSFLATGLFPPDPFTGRYDTTDDYAIIRGDTVSPFAQGIWNILPTLELDAGVRWTRETKSTVQYNTFVNTFSVLTGILPPGNVLSGSQVFYNTSPEATLTWHPAEHLMLYGAYKTGYKSGGYSGGELLYGNATTTAADIGFKPEKSHGGEIGAKGLFLGDRLQITGAIYDYTYKDLQESIFNTATTTFSTQNAAAASTKGIESDITWRVIPELTLNAGLTYNRARFTDYSNASCYSAEPGPTCNPVTAGTTPYQNLTGTRLPYSSDFAESVGFKWDRAVPMLDGYLFSLGSHLQYLSTFTTDTNENPTARFGPEFLLDANLSVYPVSEHWKIQVTGRNLLNEQYLASAVDRAGSSNAVGGAVSDIDGTLNRPREIWLQLTEKF